MACLYDARDIHVAMSVPWKEYPAWGSGDLMDVPINGENIGVVATIDGESPLYNALVLVGRVDLLTFA